MPRFIRITCLPTSVTGVADKGLFSSFVADCGPRALKPAAWVAAAFKAGVYHLRSYEHLFRGWTLRLNFGLTSVELDSFGLTSGDLNSFWTY